MDRHNCTDTIDGAALTSALPLSWQSWFEDGKTLLLAEMTRAWATVKLWRSRSVQRADLARLDDRMLDDIGVGRTEAERVARKPFWKA